MNTELLEAIQLLEKEKNISKESLIEGIEGSLLSACKEHFKSVDNIKLEMDHDTCEYSLYAEKTIVDGEPEDPELEISKEAAALIEPEKVVGDIVRVPIESKSFGRIATQKAKNMILQRIREEERQVVYNEFKEKEHTVVTGRVQRVIGRSISVNLGHANAILTEKEQARGEHYRQGDLITGTVQRISNETIFVNIGNTEGILVAGERAAGERYRVNDRIKAYIMDVRKSNKGPQIFLSRTHPGFVEKLFELEVPEIEDGDVVIKSIAREAGSRTKIAVYTEDEDIDPVGACVGQNGNRVRNIVDELWGEKIDITTWDEDPAILISNVLSPAKVEAVAIDEEEKSAVAVVPDYQLSLAIGKEGQNVRLAAKLCGWKIDIKSHTQYFGDEEYDEEFYEEDEE